MEYKDFIHEELENGKVRLLASLGMDIVVTKEEFKKLSGLNPRDVGNLVQDWIRNGYAESTKTGDSYFVDTQGDLGDRIYFNIEQIHPAIISSDKEQSAWIADMVEEVEDLSINAPDEGIIDAIDADTILVDLLQKNDFKFPGFAQDIFSIWKNSTDKAAVEQMFYEFTGREFDEYLTICIKEIDRPDTSLEDKMRNASERVLRDVSFIPKKEINRVPQNTKDVLTSSERM